MLHSLSFVEDPTRILRAVRLEQRLAFRIEPRTEELVADAVALLERTSGDRIRHELYRILEEPRDVPSRSLRRLDDLGVLSTVHPALGWTPAIDARLIRLREAPGCLATREVDQSIVANAALADVNRIPAPYSLALVAYDLDATAIEGVGLALKLSRTDLRLLREVVALRARLPRLTAPDLPDRALVRLLEPFSRPALCVLRVAEPDPVLRARLDRYLDGLSHVRPTLRGDTLRAMGLPPGPIYREILGKLRDARLQGDIADDGEERALAERLVAEAKAAS